MDFLYDFKQASVDRMEDAGINVYHNHKDEQPAHRVGEKDNNRQAAVRRAQRVVTALVNIVK